MKSRPLFAEFGVRIFALFFDFIIVVFAATSACRPGGTTRMVVTLTVATSRLPGKGPGTTATRQHAPGMPAG